MKDETLSTDSTHKNKKLVPSFSVPNFKEKNNSNITDNNNNYRLNFNYDFNKINNNYKQKENSSNNDYKKESNSNINIELMYFWELFVIPVTLHPKKHRFCNVKDGIFYVFHHPKEI